MPGRSVLREALVVAAVGLACAFFVTIDVWRAPSSTLAGDWTHPDMLSNHWVYEWVADQLRHAGSLLHNDRYYLPIGDAPFLAGNASGAILAAPFLVALGHPLGLNVYITLVLAGNVGAGYALARALGAKPLPALLGGTGFGLCPYLLAELSAARFAQVPAWEMAAGVALFIGAIRDGSWRRGAAAGAIIGLGGVEYFYYGLFGGLAGGFVLLSAILAGEKKWFKPALAGAIAGAAVVGPMLAVFLHGWNTVVGATEAGTTFPHPFMLQASLPWSWPLWTDVPAMVPQSVSWLLLTLAVVEWRLARREPGAWATRAVVWTGVAGWLLTLGPQLVTPQGTAEGSHLPFWWLYSLHPALSRFWWPYRHAVMVAMAVAGLGAAALSRLWVRLPPRLGMLTIAVAVGGVMLELKSRQSMVAIKTSRLKEEPTWVAKVEALPEGGIVDLPASPELWIAQQHLTLAEEVHRQLLEGHAMWVDRVRPDEWDAMIKANSFLAEVQRFERGQPDLEDPTRVDRFEYDPKSCDALVTLGIRWVVVWDELFAPAISELPDKLNTVLPKVLGKPVIAETGYTVYDLTTHESTGVVPAPIWSWPAGVKTGDGSSRMTDALPESQLLESPEK